jgi:fatty-acyl-CoA synthase
VTAEPTPTIGTRPLPSVAERQRALEAQYAPWQPRTLDQLLAHVARRHPDREFVVTDERTWTYAEVDAWAARLAAGLAAAGVQPGEHVAVVLANYPEFVALKFAISRVGATAVPINFLNRRDELGFVLRQSDAVALVTMDRFRDLDYLHALDELAPGWERDGGGTAFPRLRRVFVFPTAGTEVRAGATPFAALERTGSAGAAATPADPQAPSDIIYTSGTTGAPKGVLLTHDMMLRAAYGSAYGRAFEDGRRIVFALPMYHVYGYVEGLLAALFAGGAIVPRLKFDAEDTLSAIERHRATDVLLIPTMTLALIEQQKKRRHELPTLRATISSGGRAPAYIWDAIREWLGPLEVVTGYGMTECTASTTVTRPDDPPERLLETNGRLRDVGAAGNPECGNRIVEYRVIDPETGADVPPGDVGELVANGPGVTRGYYRNEAATAAVFTPDGWLHTGDLGRIDADGYLKLMGRLKESYRCGGETVLPTDAEDQLVLHPAVLQAHVVPVPDARMGEVGAAFVVPRPGATVDPEALIAHCRERLARFKVPKYVLSVAAEEIPVTPSGRARKFMLTKLAMQKLGLE